MEPLIGVITHREDFFRKWITINRDKWPGCEFKRISKEADLFGYRFNKLLKIDGSEKVHPDVIGMAEDRTASQTKLDK